MSEEIKEFAPVVDLNQASQEAPKFDPSKKYTWSPNDTFVFSGSEFGVVLNALRATLSTQEAARILLANEAHGVVEGALAKAVEAGVVKEVVETPKNSL